MGADIDQALLDRVLRRAEGGPQTAHQLGEFYQAELDEVRGARRASGVFYTPPHLVDFIIEKTLEPLLAERSAEEVLALRLVDPSCGSGVFLVAALSAIETALVERGRKRGKALREAIASSCLCGIDIDPIAIELCRRALSSHVAGNDAAPGSVNLDDVDLRCADSLLDSGLGTFDVVIGNPPWGQKELRFDDATKALLRENYQTATGVLDPFKLFIERAHQILELGGVWAFVLPDIVLLKNHRTTRELILARSELCWVVHVGRAFANVNLDACVIIARHRTPQPNHQVATATTLPIEWKRNGLQHRLRSQSRFSSLNDSRLNIIATDDELELVDKLKRFPRLGDRFEIHEGVHSGNRRQSLFVRHRPVPGARLIFGRTELEPFRARWNGRYIDLSDEAIDRRNGGYANLGQPEWHLRGRKIIVRRTGDRVIAAIETTGSFVSNNFFVVFANHQLSHNELKAVVAVLNSRFMTWYFRTVQPRTGRLFAELKIVHLRDFPLPTMSSRQISELARIANQLALGPISAANGCALDAELDRAVADLFDLSPSAQAVSTILQ